MAECVDPLGGVQHITQPLVYHSLRGTWIEETVLEWATQCMQECVSASLQCF